MEDRFGEAKWIIGAANVICGEATWSLLIKTAFGRFNQLVMKNSKKVTMNTKNKWIVLQLVYIGHVNPVFLHFYFKN